MKIANRRRGRMMWEATGKGRDRDEINDRKNVTGMDFLYETA